MKTIQVNSLPLKDVIADIARAFGVDYTASCDEYALFLPTQVGEGWIRGINFENGLGILQYDCTFVEDTEIQFVINEVHPLKFLYCTEGELVHSFGESNNLHTIEKYKKAIVASSKHNGHILHFKAGIHVVVNSLEIARNRFAQKVACDLKSLNKPLKDLFTDVKASKEFYYDGFYSLQLADSFTEIEAFDGDNFLRKLFLEGKAYQVLTRQIIEYLDDLKEENKRSVLKTADVRQIKEAAALLRDELSNGQTIKSLSKQVGLNPNKLQKGFQHFYNASVNQYLHTIRLEHAKELLLNTNHSIAQIVEAVGLSSKSYFSKIFKEKYGDKPSQFRSKHLNKLGDDDFTI
ncbi:MAG: AraC family transcriptional regulator [Pricia sp.]